MSYELMFQKAVDLHFGGALNEAEQIYRQILETAPKNADVLNLLGLIAQQRGFHQEAVNYFYKAAENAPKHFPIFFNLAVSLEALEKHLEALEAYDKVLKIKSDVKEAHFGRAKIFWYLSQEDKAEIEFQKALNIDENYVEAMVDLAEMKNEEAKLVEYAKKYPDFAASFYYLGRCKFKAKNYKDAQNYLQTADSLSESADIKVLLAETLMKNGEKSDALKLFYQAISINPRNSGATLKIADIETENYNFKEAEKYYKRTIELEPQNLSAHTNYANMLYKTKRTLEALEEYRAAVLIAPETPEISYNLALILKELKDYEQSLYLMFNAFYLAPEHTDWSINLAETLVLYYKQEPEKALKIAQNWYEKMPQNPVTNHIRNALNGRKSENEAEYNSILFDVFAPTYEETLQNIEYAAAKKIAQLCGDIKGRILDLGCGTGLLGVELKSEENEIIGIDISKKMLQIAEKKNVYAKLIQADIVDFLQKKSEHFDLITAADVFCYFGDLAPLFKLIYPQKLVFSIETNPLIETFEIQPNGRYRHNPQYIQNLLKANGYRKLNTTSLVLRNEEESQVLGIIIEAEE